MSEKATVSGLLSLIDETTGVTGFSYRLEDIQAAITGMTKVTKNTIALAASATDVAIDFGNVTTPKVILIYIKSGDGPITIKHDSNANVISISKMFMLFGSITTVTMSNPDAVEKTIEIFVSE